MSDVSAALLDQLVTPLGECLTPEVARRVADLRASPALERRIHRLGQKCSEGELNAGERNEYETLVRFVKFVSVLQAKARRQLVGVGA